MNYYIVLLQVFNQPGIEIFNGALRVKSENEKNAIDKIQLCFNENYKVNIKRIFKDESNDN